MQPHVLWLILALVVQTCSITAFAQHNTIATFGASPGSLQYDSVSNCDPVTKKIIIGNDAGAPLTINSIQLADPSLGFTIVRKIKAVLAPQEIDSILIQFASPTLGPVSTTLNVNTDQGILPIPLRAVSVAPTPIRFALSVPKASGHVEEEVRFPVEILDTSTIDVNDIELVLSGNTDLLTPIRIEVDSSVLQGAIVENLTVLNRQSTIITIGTGIPQHLHRGKLFTIVAKPYLTDTLHSTHSIGSVQLNKRKGVNPCLATVGIGATDFDLLTICGDTVISRAMAGEVKSLMVNLISSNPTNGQIRISLVNNHKGPVTVEELDERGRVLQRKNLLMEGDDPQEVSLQLTGSSGIRYLHFRYAGVSRTISVVLAR